MPHSIRGKVAPEKEGPRYCVACHLTTDGLAAYGTGVQRLAHALASPTLSGLDGSMFQVLKTHFGQNTGNQMNSPLWVHMVAGLGTGLFLFDENGAAVNPLDTNPDRIGSGGVAPATTFDLAHVAFNLDRIVECGWDFNDQQPPDASGGSGDCAARWGGEPGYVGAAWGDVDSAVDGSDYGDCARFRLDDGAVQATRGRLCLRVWAVPWACPVHLVNACYADQA
ncbi:MAG: hypothetical protein R3E96_03400 [Planctomycetota bacterium]